MYLIMLSATIAGATFAGILGGYAVQKIFYTLIGGFTYLYLFLTVGGSFEPQVRVRRRTTRGRRGSS